MPGFLPFEQPLAAESRISHETGAHLAVAENYSMQKVLKQLYDNGKRKMIKRGTDIRMSGA